jgi:hypothetical protein
LSNESNKSVLKKFFRELSAELALGWRNAKRLVVRNVKRNRLEKGIDITIESILAEIFKDPKNKAWVKSTINNKFNIVSIDLSEYKGGNHDLKQLTKDITKAFNRRFTENNVSMAFLRKFNNISFHIITGGEEAYNENCQIFYGHSTREYIKPVLKKSLLGKISANIWAWPTLITIAITILLTYFSVHHFLKASADELDKIAVINQNINFVTGIFGSFIMTFLMTRVLNLRQEKLKRAPQIRTLSDKLAQFQKICFHLINDNDFWNKSDDFAYAKKIGDRISYWDARGIRVGETDEEFHYYQSLITAPGFRTDIIWLYLQLKMFANLHPMKNINLLYTTHAPIRIYRTSELEDFLVFIGHNEIESYLGREDNKATYNPQSTFGKNIIAAAKLFDPEKFKDSGYSKNLLISVAEEVENKVLPNLYNLLSLNEEGLPLSVRYYFFSVVSVIFLTVIWPVVFNLFLSNKLFLNIGSILLLGVFIHILLMLRIFLKKEATLKLPDDYR